MAFRAVVADCAYGDQDGFRRQLAAAGLPFVMALKPSHGTWAYGKDAYTPVHAAHALTWTDPEHPGDWTAVERTFRDGHTETWWAADATQSARQLRCIAPQARRYASAGQHHRLRPVNIGSRRGQRDTGGLLRTSPQRRVREIR